MPAGIAAGAALLLGACGADPAVAPAATATPTAFTGPTAVDSCLVGTWHSTSISGSITVAGARVAITGGAGEVLVIDAAGTIRTDDTATALVTGNAPDGTQYTLQQSGSATGKVTAAAGALTVAIDQPTTLTVTLLRNGVQVQSRHPGSASDTYVCAPRSTLIITGAGGTVTRYSPG